ncbi:MAG TPA: glycosyltransferase family 39 protein [Phycisphaerae bacterium]|nr:glycosyltransferase family 39 protein [Phycisphaerae bacterium]
MPQSPWAILILAMLLVLIPTVTLSQIAAHYRADVMDDQMFGYYGWRILHGATVYRDVWDNKPPGIYWINALGFLIGGDSYVGVIVLCVLAVVAAHACLFVAAASNYYRGAAALTTVLASFYMTHAYYQGGTNRTETFLVACELAAVALYMRGFARDRWWKWLLAGVCCGCAFLFKQVGLAAWGAMGLHTIILVVTRDLSWRDGLRRCLLLLAGVCGVLLVAGLALASQGALGEACYATFGFNRAYFRVGLSSLLTRFINFAYLKWEIKPVLLLPILMAIAASIHAILWWLRPRFRPREIEEPMRALRPVCPRYMLLFGIWFAVAFWGALVSPHHFRHYLLPTIPPLLLLAGYLINVLRAEIGLVRRLQQRAWVLATFVAMGYFAMEAFYLHFQVAAAVWYYRFHQQQRPDWEIIAEQVERFTKPEDKIQCWGYQPGVYLHTRRINACRFTTTEKLGHVKQEAAFIGDELRQTLSAEPPALFVISAGDYGWCHEPQDSPRYPGPLGHWLAGWLHENYEIVQDIAEVNTYLLKRKDLIAGEGG